MTWSATQLNNQLIVGSDKSYLEVRVRLVNDAKEPFKIDVTIILEPSSDANQLKRKVLDVTNRLERLLLMQDNLNTVPQVDTSPFGILSNNSSRIL